MKRSSPQSKHSNEINELKIILNDLPDFDYELIASNFVHWQPLFDLYIINEKVVVTIELAGVKKKDISLYVNKRYMVIEGTRQSPRFINHGTCTFHNIELPYGRFYRKIDFPALIEPKAYNYTFCNGLLTIEFDQLKEKVIPIEDG